MKSSRPTTLPTPKSLRSRDPPTLFGSMTRIRDSNLTFISDQELFRILALLLVEQIRALLDHVLVELGFFLLESSPRYEAVERDGQDCASMGNISSCSYTSISELLIYFE